MRRWCSSNGRARIRETVVSGYWPARYEVVIRALVDERQIVYMGFVLVTRIIMGLLMMPLYRRKAADEAGSTFQL